MGKKIEFASILHSNFTKYHAYHALCNGTVTVLQCIEPGNKPSIREMQALWIEVGMKRFSCLTNEQTSGRKPKFYCIPKGL